MDRVPCLNEAFNSLSVNTCNGLPSWEQDTAFLLEKGIKHIYHFTDRSNVISIRQHGLLSSVELEKRGLTVQYQQGNQASRLCGRANDLKDYIKFSIVAEHPLLMQYIEEKRIVDPVILVYPVDVLIDKENTKFCNCNAAMNEDAMVCNSAGEAFHMLDLQELQRQHANPKAIKPDQQKYLQAEILIKTGVDKPGRCITLLDFCMRQGTYIGKSYNFVIRNDIQYFMWLLEDSPISQKPMGKLLRKYFLHKHHPVEDILTIPPLIGDITGDNKYTGKSVSFVLKNDPDYFVWLMDQEWFAEKSSMGKFLHRRWQKC